MSWLGDIFAPFRRFGAAIQKESMQDAGKLWNGDFASLFQGPGWVDYYAASQPGAVDKRREFVKTLTLSTIPEVAAIQKQAQEEYVQTGQWNPKYTQAADAYRVNVLGFSLPSGAGPVVILLGVGLLALIIRR